MLSRRQMMRVSIQAGLSLAVAPIQDVLASQHMIIKRKIPSSGELLPVIGLGTWQTFDVSESNEMRKSLREVLQRLAQTERSMIDSSPMYGTAERVVGDLTTELNLRSRLFFATKVWTTGKDAGIRQINESFSKMKTDVIDLLQVHNLVDVQTHLKTLRDLKSKGKIKYLGVTHYHSGAFADLIKLVKTEKLDFVQFNYNIGSREAENQLLSICQEYNAATIINRPFEEGQLFQQVKGKPLPAWASDYEIKSWGQFFLKYILSHPEVTCTIPGTDKLTHLVDNLEAGTGNLPDEKARKKMVDYFVSL